MAYLTREQILKADDRKSQDVEVPEWGGTVRVTALSGTERDSLEASMIEGKGRKSSVNLSNLRAKLVALAVRDEDGKRVFTDADVADLGKKSAAALDRVFAVARTLSGLSDNDVEELTKNSESDRNEDSGSN